MDSGKFWRLLLRPLISRALLLFAVAGPCASAQQPVNGEATLEAFLDNVRSLTATFEQQLWTADHELLQTDSGSFSLQRPNRFRWTYRTRGAVDADPTELIIVADGTRLWIYDVELEEVTVAPFDDTVGTSPAMLLSGDRSVHDGFDVVEASSFDGLDWVKLEPKATSDFSSMLIGFRGTEPRRLELVDGLGQVTRIEFGDLVVNPEIADEVFELDVPEGVNVIGGEG